MPCCWNCGAKLKEGIHLCPKCHKNQRPQSLSEALTAQSGLLDFYSDRAVAHASFLLASIFGLVTLLAIVQEMTRQNPIIRVCGTLIPLVYISLIPFWAFTYLGYHTLRRFKLYADIAHKLGQQLNLCVSDQFIEEHVNKPAHKADKELIIKRVLDRLPRKWHAPALYFAYWLV